MKYAINRPQNWKELDFKIIEKEVGFLDKFEYCMCMNQCQTEEVAILSIKAKRKSDDDFIYFLQQCGLERKREHYRRSKYKEIEEDIEDEYF